jgi:GTPase SAR1 family protein
MTRLSTSIKRIRRSDRLRFMSILFGVVVSAAWLSTMMRRAWVTPEGLNPLSTYAQMVGLSPTDLGAALVGIYLGMSMLLLFDELRQTQGILLVAGAIVALVGVYVVSKNAGQLKYYDIGLMTLAGLFGGWVVGFFVGGGMNILGDQSDELKFPRANAGIVAFVALGLLAVFVETFFNYTVIQEGGLSIRAVTDPLLGVVDAAAIVLFVLSMYKFVGYEAKSNVVVLGKGRVGKTHFMLGLFHEVRNSVGVYGSENVERPLGMLYDQESWLDTNDPGDIEEMRFTYLDGRLPRKLRTISLLDYPGQVFKYVPDALETGVDRATLRSRVAQTLDQSGESQSNGSNQEDIATDGGEPDWAPDTDDKSDTDDESDVDDDQTDVEESEDGESTSGNAGAANIVDDLLGSGGPGEPPGIVDQIQTSELVLLIIDLESFKADLSGESTSESTSTQPSDGGDEPWTTDEPWLDEPADLSPDEDVDSGDDDTTTFEMKPYSETVSKLSNQDKTVILVGTKADKYADMYPYPPQGNYDQFQQDITRDFSNHGSVRGLLRNNNVKENVYPVYIREDPDTGEPDFGGQREKKLRTYGFEELLDVIEVES